MKATELIAALQSAVAEHGDFVCASNDGQDPSDYEEISKVLFAEDRSYWSHKQAGWISEPFFLL